jgi:hypothetical protein
MKKINTIIKAIIILFCMAEASILHAMNDEIKITVNETQTDGATRSYTPEDITPSNNRLSDVFYRTSLQSFNILKNNIGISTLQNHLTSMLYRVSKNIFLERNELTYAAGIYLLYHHAIRNKQLSKVFDVLPTGTYIAGSKNFVPQYLSYSIIGLKAWYIMQILPQLQKTLSEHTEYHKKHTEQLTGIQQTQNQHTNTLNTINNQQKGMYAKILGLEEGQKLNTKDLEFLKNLTANVSTITEAINNRTSNLLHEVKNIQNDVTILKQNSENTDNKINGFEKSIHEGFNEILALMKQNQEQSNIQSNKIRSEMVTVNEKLKETHDDIQTIKTSNEAILKHQAEQLSHALEQLATIKNFYNTFIIYQQEQKETFNKFNGM